ncbi:Zinc finger, RING/FYVE/PHD-type, partial [Cynara cardunculus var. scolymus]
MGRNEVDCITMNPDAAQVADPFHIVEEADDSTHCNERCGHGYHVECLEAWLKEHTNCPLRIARVSGYIVSLFKSLLLKYSSSRFVEFLAEDPPGLLSWPSEWSFNQPLIAANSVISKRVRQISQIRQITPTWTFTAGKNAAAADFYSGDTFNTLAFAPTPDPVTVASPPAVVFLLRRDSGFSFLKAPFSAATRTKLSCKLRPDPTLLICHTGLLRPTWTPPRFGLLGHFLDLDSPAELLLEQGALLTFRLLAGDRGLLPLFPADLLRENGHKFIFSSAIPVPPFLSFFFFSFSLLTEFFLNISFHRLGATNVVSESEMGPEFRSATVVMVGGLMVVSELRGEENTAGEQFIGRMKEGFRARGISDHPELEFRRIRGAASSSTATGGENCGIFHFTERNLEMAIVFREVRMDMM